MVAKKQGNCYICDTPIMASSTYCRKHAALSRWGHTDKDLKSKHKIIAKEVANVGRTFSSELPEEIIDVMKDLAGKTEYKHLETDLQNVMEMARMAKAPPQTTRSQGGYESQLYGSLFTDKSSKPNPTLNYASEFNIQHIEDMMKCGQVVFGLALKKAPIASLFRNKRSYAFEFDGVKSAFQTAIEENMYELFPKAINNFLTSMEYGASFNEVVWKVDKGNPLVEDINSIYLGAIKSVKYTGPSFRGFEQTSSTGIAGKPIKIPLEQSLVISFNKKFRNIWGESALKPVFPFFFFYDIIWRSFVRYLERTGTPQLLATAPSNYTVRKSDGTHVEALDEAINIAYRGSRSPAIAIPSDRDADGNLLWTLEYLRSDMRGEQFINALNLLGTLILRSVILPDTVATTQGTGSYGMADVHYTVTLLDSERVVTEIVGQINKYLMEKFILYKYGANSDASVRLVTEGLNMTEKDALLRMMIQAINGKHAVVNDIDWQGLAAVNNIPIKEGAYDDPNFGGTPVVAAPATGDTSPTTTPKKKPATEAERLQEVLDNRGDGGLILGDKEIEDLTNS